jgi:thymidylate synthase ThyX
MQVILHTEPNAEDNAMVQALYSRSPKSVTVHLERVAKTGSGKFMEQYYLGYGHPSIADCGFVTLYFEGISMLAAKAIEDSPLYNGQECSSRYIDFSDQFFLNSYDGTDHACRAAILLAEMRSFYVSSLGPVRASLRERFPKAGGVSDTVYEKTISARCFDILRGFLPAGATTNASWTTSLRKAHERLILLMHHPLPEVRTLATKAYQKLYEAYPHSFESKYCDGDVEKVEEAEVFCHLSKWDQFYATLPSENSTEMTLGSPQTRIFPMSPGRETYTSPRPDAVHPRKTQLPRHGLGSTEILKIELTTDFGSFRDLQRHRAGYCSMPLLDTALGFHLWYLDQLPEPRRAVALGLLRNLNEFSKIVDSSSETLAEPLVEAARRQYIIPMGTLVPVSLVYSLAQATYVAELRSGKTVHPTLRPFAQSLARTLEDLGVPVHADLDDSDWTTRRGQQDITPKLQSLPHSNKVL